MNYNLHDKIKFFDFGWMKSPYNSAITISHEEFLLFHSIDRELYKILVINFVWQPIKSMQVLALWIWLERVGFRGLVKKILSLPNFIIYKVAEEGVVCLTCINDIDTISSSFLRIDIPLLRGLFVHKEISLRILYENRVLAIQGMEKIMHHVCDRVFSDIVQEAEIRRIEKERY